jgi:hypothetical protein
MYLMEYNTTEEKLILPEYGRNIQKMANYLVNIEDRERRTKAAHELVGVMASLTPTPSQRDVKEFKQKLWDHLALMTNYKLDIDYPFPINRPETRRKLDLPVYSTNRIARRHYGKITEELIKKAILLDDGDEKRWLVQLIANYMKKQYIAWNMNTVNDDIIYKDFIEMSHGKLDIDTSVRIYVAPNMLPTAPIINSRNDKNLKRNDNRKKYGAGSGSSNNNNRRPK